MRSSGTRKEFKAKISNEMGRWRSMPCNLWGKGRDNEETFHGRGQGERMNHELNARTRCFEIGKGALCIHLDGHRQLVIGLEQTDWRLNMELMGCLFSSAAFGMF